jgi:hypothetical protein
MKEIDVIDDKFKIPKGVEYPVIIKYPFHTERHYKSDGRLRTVQFWYRQKRAVPDNQMIINGTIYHVNLIDTAKCLGEFLAAGET